MSDEIKEILEQLEWYRKIGKKDVYYPECVLPNKKAFILLDYITNLQEENESLAKDVDFWRTKYNEEFNEALSLTVYKSRCEKANEILEQDKASASFNTAERIALNILNGGDKE